MSAFDRQAEPASSPLTDEELIDWLRLIRSENVGPTGIMAQTPQAEPQPSSHL